jgi:hypothetical protein
MSVLCLFLVATVVGGVPSPAGAAVDVDVAACTVAGHVTAAPAVTVLPKPVNYAATLTAACLAPAGDDGGAWAITANAFGPLESCAGGEGTGTFAAGGTSQFDGAVTGGSFTYVRTSNVVNLEGKLQTSLDDEPHHVTFHLVLVPDNSADCVNTAVTGATISGTATIADMVEDAAACAVTGVINYGGAGSGPIPGPVPFALNLAAACVGLGDEAGLWNITAVGLSNPESCAEGVAVAAVVGGGGTTNDGTITGGSLNFVRTGLSMHVAATIFTSADGGAAHAFVADLAWVPTPPCPVFNANLAGPGAVSDT